MRSIVFEFGSRFRLTALVAGLFLTLFHSAEAAIINARSVSFADVQSAIILASDGDTVAIPAGTASWTSTLSLKKAITLQGAGKEVTIIKDDVPQPSNVMDVTLVAGKVTRITGLQLTAGARTTNGNAGIQLNGINNDGSRVRVDNCKFNGLLVTGALWPKGVLGVADHNEFIGPGHGHFFCYTYHQNWNGGDNSDRSWADGPHYGTDQFWFMEDNTLTMPAAGETYAGIDSYRGARVVFRHNTCTDSTTVSAHGTESSGRTRGTRCLEIYDNTFGFTPGKARSNVANIRSGSAVLFNNKASGFIASHAFDLDIDRSTDTFPAFGIADGDIPWDPVESNSGDNGTATGGGTLTMSDSSKSWAPNQWAGYTLRQVKTSGTATSGSGKEILVDSTQNWPAATWAGAKISGKVNVWMLKNTTTGQWGYVRSQTANSVTFTGFGPNVTFSPGDHYEFVTASRILSNTATEIVYAGTVSRNPMSFTSGEKYSIKEVHQVLDQPGLGTCDNLGGASQPIPANLHQTVEPIYAWNNSVPGGDSGAIGSSGFPTLHEGLHYFNGTPMPGYKPFTYPHPLVSGAPVGPSPPAAPKNLRVAPTQ